MPNDIATYFLILMVKNKNSGINYNTLKMVMFGWWAQKIEGQRVSSYSSLNAFFCRLDFGTMEILYIIIK